MSAWIPSSAIAKANEEVEQLLMESTSEKGGKRGQWKKKYTWYLDSTMDRRDWVERASTWALPWIGYSNS